MNLLLIPRLNLLLLPFLGRLSAGARRAAAQAELSACRAELDAARNGLDAAGVIDEAKFAALAALLRDGRASLDACAERLGEDVRVLLQRSHDSGSALVESEDDEIMVASCKAKVAALVAKVGEASAEQQQQGQSHDFKQLQKQSDPDQRKGKRLITRARMLGRPMLESVVTEERAALEARKQGGKRVLEAVENIDVAPKETDHIREECGLAGFEATPNASRVAEEVHKVMKVGVVEDPGARVERARTFMRLGAQEIAELEAEAAALGLGNKRNVVKAFRVARRGLRKVSSAMGEGKEADAGRRRHGRTRFEALIANGTLAAALKNVEVARSEILRTLQVSTLETEARNMLSREATRADEVSHQAQELGLLKRPAVVRALQSYRASVMAAERYNRLDRSVSLVKRMELARDYTAAALQASEASRLAEKTLAAERDAAAKNEEARRRLEGRLQESKSSIFCLQDRLGKLATAAQQRRALFEAVRALVTSPDMSTATDRPGSHASLPAEPDGAAVAQIAAEAMRDLDDISRRVNGSWNVTSLEEYVDSGIERVIHVEAATAQSEVQGRRRDIAFAALKRAAEKTRSMMQEAQAARVEGRPAMVDSLSAASRLVKNGFSAAVDSADPSCRGGMEADEPFLYAANQAEAAAEAAAQVLSRERLYAEQGEKERKERCSELWSASRRLEELDTAAVVVYDPEAVAIVLEARSEVVQVRRATANASGQLMRCRFFACATSISFIFERSPFPTRSLNSSL